MTNILEMTGICKQFPGVIALNNVNLTVKAGEVLALMGENGAGKSTLIKILAGVYDKDQGQIIFNGKKVKISSPHHAHTIGISTIFQELNLLPNLNVAENIFMGDENRSFGAFVDFQSTYQKAEQLMKRVGLSCDPKTLVQDLPVSQRQMVEVAKALSLKSKLIIMDEPTSSLTEHETQLLFKIIRDLKSQGVSVIYISHRINEIFEIADRVLVLRDGVNAGELERHEMSEESIIQMMVGRELKNIFAKSKVEIGSTIFAVQNLSTAGFLSDISFSLKRGEILGIAGLVGAGRTELIRAIFGLDPRISGKIMIDNKVVSIKSPEQAIRLGMAFVTEDRRGQGLVTGMSVRENSTLVTLNQIHKWGFIKNKIEYSIVKHFIQLLRIKTPSMETKVATLSGGNQQKVVLAKWLANKPKILILDEPTRGIDVGAKAEIHRIMSDLAGKNSSHSHNRAN